MNCIYCQQLCFDNSFTAICDQEGESLHRFYLTYNIDPDIKTSGHWYLSFLKGQYNFTINKYFFTYKDFKTNYKDTIMTFNPPIDHIKGMNVVNKYLKLKAFL